MAIRKLLLPLQTAATAEAAFSTAAIVSQMWCAHLAVLHVTADRKHASAVREAFESLAAKHGLTVTEARPNADKPTASFAAIVGREPEVVAYQARLADLIVVPHPGAADVSSSDALHAVLFDSVQPVLIAPRIAPATIGRRICLDQRHERIVHADRNERKRQAEARGE